MVEARLVALRPALARLARLVAVGGGREGVDAGGGRKFEAKAERFERKMRSRFDKQTQKYSGVSADPAENMPPPPQFKNDAERQTYERARKRAQAEAGFFVHLMLYGIIIGFLFIINLMTSPGHCAR